MDLDSNSPNLSMNLYRDSSSACHRLASVADVTMRLASCILRIEALNKGVKAVDGPWRESTILGQCCPFKGRGEDTS